VPQPPEEFPIHAVASTSHHVAVRGLQIPNIVVAGLAALAAGVVVAIVAVAATPMLMSAWWIAMPWMERPMSITTCL
jgi:hypothetical protein